MIRLQVYLEQYRFKITSGSVFDVYAWDMKRIYMRCSAASTGYGNLSVGLGRDVNGASVRKVG